jgi:hypothetical protein
MCTSLCQRSPGILKNIPTVPDGVFTELLSPGKLLYAQLDSRPGNTDSYIFHQCLLICNLSLSLKELSHEIEMGCWW